MASHLLHLLLLLLLLTVGMVEITNADLSPQLYWKSALPKTTMPKSIRDALESKNTKWMVSKPSGLDIEQLQLRVANPQNSNLYFLEQDIIKNGNNMTLDLSAPPSARSAKFLPRQEAEKIPFSSKKLPEILNHLSVKPGSVEAKTIERTLKDLEQLVIEGQLNFVATSLEAMIDFIDSEIEIEVEIGGVEIEVEVSSTEVEIEVEVGGEDIIDVEIPIGLYGAKNGTSRKILSEETKALICQKLEYPYAVHYCHGLAKTRAYSVPLEGANGMKVNALALCHVDTSDWNPNHSAFEMLKIERGTVPVCQFLPQDHLLWFTKN